MKASILRTTVKNSFLGEGEGKGMGKEKREKRLQLSLVTQASGNAVS